MMTDSSVKISLIIINYNGRKYLKNCLDAIKQSNYSFEKIETIMVDNASVDGSIDYIRSNYPWVNMLELDKNYGFAMANNIGVESAHGEYIFFLNNDTVVTPNWLAELLDIMEKNREIGIAGSKILFLDAHGKINSAGGNITFTGEGYDIGFLDNDSEKYNETRNRGCICAAAMMVRREEFLRLGGFDGDYFMYFEDTDLCWRYWLYGKKVIYVPTSVVQHKFGGTTSKFRHAPLRVFYGTRNSLLNVIKNYETHNIPFPIIFSFLYHIVKTLYFILTLNFSLALLIIKAYGSFLRLLPWTIAKRRYIQKNRKVRDRYLFDNSLIVSCSGSFKEFLRLLKLRV